MPTTRIKTSGKEPRRPHLRRPHLRRLPPPQATALLTLAFATDPVIAYFLAPMAAAARAAYLPAYMGALLKAAALNGASFDEAVAVAAVEEEGEEEEEEAGVGDADVDADADADAQWESCGVLMAPGKKVDNVWTLLPAGLVGVCGRIGVVGCWGALSETPQRMLAEYASLADAAKAKALRGRRAYFYIFFLATHPDSRKRGLCSALVREYQARAAKQGLPLWLEATTAYSMSLYRGLGFTVVDEMVLGKGKVGADGLDSKGGEGVKVWGMIWEPEEVK